MGIPDRYFLFLGNLEPKKNILHIAETFTELRRRNPNAPSLVLAGKKGWRHGKVLHKLSNFLGRDDVQWIGYVTAEERAALYRGAVATLLVSREEGFGLPVIESMACGAPVVVSDAPALVEVAGAAAPVVPMDDRDALVMELERLGDDAAYRTQWAEAGLRRAAQFTWRRAAELTLDTYRRALNADARRTDFKEQP
jgi:alpha-1,3-rhamnosyl/mannosyltransferase